VADYSFSLWWEKMKALVVHPYEGDDFQAFVATLCVIAWDKGHKDGVVQGEFASVNRHQRRLEVAAVLKDEELIIDALRYRWLKSRKGLDLRSSNVPWMHQDRTAFCQTHQLAEGGTGHAAYPTLDQTIDAAMIVAQERDGDTP